MANNIICLDKDQFKKLAALLGIPYARSIYWPSTDITFTMPKETLYELSIAYADGDQSLRVEQWPEGHVVWANGKIIFKSWET